MFKRLPGLARFILALTAIDLFVFAAFRGAFWAAFHEALANASRADLLKALYLGFKYDLRLALLLCLPLALVGWIALFDPARRRAARIAWLAYLAVAQCAVLLAYFVDFGHYAYVRVRLNASLVDHLTPVGVAARVAWEAYPLLSGVLGLLLLTSAYVWIVRRAAQRTLVPATPPLGKWPRRAAVAALAALYALGIYGKWSWYPLRWSEAYFSSSEAVAALALNPVLFLMDTAENRNLPYDADKVREHYAYTAALLGVKTPDPEKLDFARYVTPAGKPPVRYNLVVIHLESFAAFKSGVFGNALDATPYFAFIQTAGNHRPYTIPSDRRGFELAQMSDAALHDNGFDSLAAYNGLRFLDYALESFFTRAREAPYFRDTVFVMYGDHGNPSTRQTPWEQLRLTGFHVPLVIYAPALIKRGRRIDFTASLPDSLPTYLSLLGVPYLNTGLGRDLLGLGAGDQHFSLIEHAGVLDDEFYLRLDPDVARLFRYRSQEAAKDVHERYPERVAELRRLHDALYETSKYMLYHNPARPHTPQGA